MKVRNLGLRLLWLENVRLFHFESRTRDKTVLPYEHQLVLARWGLPDRDDYLPGLTYL